MTTITYDEIKRFDHQYKYWSTAKELAINPIRNGVEQEVKKPHLRPAVRFRTVSPKKSRKQETLANL